VTVADRGYLAFMVLLPIFLGTLISQVPASEGLSGLPGTNQDAGTLLLILVVCACLSGTASSVRELMKERPIYIREWATGLSSGAYLLSKLLVLGVISIAQSTLLVLLGFSYRSLPPTGVILTHHSLLELLLDVAALAVASMCLGLLISSLTNASERALPFVVLVTMVQVVLSGYVVQLSGVDGLAQLAWVVPARWGFGAVASTANLDVISPSRNSVTDPLWAHTSTDWLRNMALTLGLAMIFTLIAWWRLSRLTPRRRW
jgi:hypothetical protein